MLLFAHYSHRYEDRASHQLLSFVAGSYRETSNASGALLSDELGELLLAQHPAKFCDVTFEDDPASHMCEKTDPAAYEIEAITVIPQNRMLYAQMSQRKRELVQKTLRRSRRARLEWAADTPVEPSSEQQAEARKRGRPPKVRE
jgi:hypothetical protein